VHAGVGYGDGEGKEGRAAKELYRKVKKAATFSKTFSQRSQHKLRSVSDKENRGQFKPHFQTP
jgi:hypothetical protein